MPNLIDEQFKPELRTSFRGRVRNYNLPPTARNSLMPLFEAMTNSLYAIQERFPENWPQKGLIEVKVLRSDELEGSESERRIIGFEISDNGLGLDDRLFEHFQELDTEYRADKNGRGIGRLSWLKVFKNTSVASVFVRSGERIERKFEFCISQENPFQKYNEETTKKSTGTTIKIVNFRDRYFPKAPQSLEEIKRQILSHFIAVFAQPQRLQIRLFDDAISENLSQFFFKSVKKESKGLKFQYRDEEFLIHHMLVEKKLAPIGNSIVYCAANRAVDFQKLNDFLGMKVIVDNKYGNLVYIGLVSGNLFNEHLNHERTGFDFGDTDFDEINRIALESTKVFLEEYLIAKRERSKRLLAQLLEINPFYASAVGDVEKYVEQMPLGWDDTQLVRDVAVKRYRAQKTLIKQVERLEANTASMTDEQFAKHVHEISDELGEAEKSALTQYVVERKLVIELLRTRRRIDYQKSEHQSEAMVHEVFCPLRTTSDVLDYDDHNLWLLDDRLAYYSYVASDRPLSSYVKDLDEPSDENVKEREELGEIKAYSEKSEPDLAIFKRPMLFRRSKTPDPIVIVEFKAPAKTKYTGSISDNPVWQIRKYVETLIDKQCYDFDGNRITDINKGTPFHCYLVAEPSTQLDELLRAHGIFKPTPDGNGRFGYLEDLDAYFEFIPYDQVLENARLRNEAFFKRLRLSDELKLNP